MRTLAKLDTYDYFILPGVIQVSLTGTNDPIMVDILAEVEQSNGRVYVEGCYYLFMGWKVARTNGKAYLELQVVETE